MSDDNKKAKSPRRGRPPSPRAEVRKNRMVTFLTDHELAEMKKRAENKDITLSAACYEIIQASLE